MGGKVEDEYDRFEDKVKDETKRIADDIGSVSERIYKDVVKPVADELWDLTVDFVDLNLDAIDYVATEGFGIEGSVDYFKDTTRGLRWVGHGMLAGDSNAWKAGAVIGASIALIVFTSGTASSVGANFAQFAYGAGATSSTALMTAYTVGTYLAMGVAGVLSTLYGITVSLSQIGEMLRYGTMNIMLMAQAMRDSMNLAFTTAFINGSMNLWRAGGILYDAPRAGDLKFNVTGDLNTVKFLNMQDKNNTTWSAWEQGKYHEFSRKTYGNMAGDEFFSVSPQI